MFREQRIDIKQKGRWAQVKLTPTFENSNHNNNNNSNSSKVNHSDDLIMNEPDVSRLLLFGDLMYMNENYFPDYALPQNLFKNIDKICNGLNHSKEYKIYSTYVQFDKIKHQNCKMNAQLVTILPGTQRVVEIGKASKTDLTPNIDSGFVEIRAFVEISTQTVHFVFNNDFSWIYECKIQNPNHYTTEWETAFVVATINGEVCGIDGKDIICQEAQKFILKMHQQLQHFGNETVRKDLNVQMEIKNRNDKTKSTENKLSKIRELSSNQSQAFNTKAMTEKGISKKKSKKNQNGKSKKSQNNAKKKVTSKKSNVKLKSKQKSSQWNNENQNVNAQSRKKFINPKDSKSKKDKKRMSFKIQKNVFIGADDSENETVDMPIFGHPRLAVDSSGSSSPEMINID